MRILIVTQFWFPDTLGGAGRYIHDLARGLQARGHQVVILTQQMAHHPREGTLHGVQIVRYPSLRSWWQVPGGWVAIRRVFHRLHRRAPFDLLVIQQSLPAVALVWDRAARRLPWLYHFQSPWAAEASMRHPSHRWDLLPGLGGWMRWAMEHQVIRHADHCITLSESMKSILVETHHLPPERIGVVPGWVNLERFHPSSAKAAIRERLGLPQGRWILITVRGLVPRQNLDGLIHAMRLVVNEHPDVLLCIGGEGPLARDLQALIDALNLTGFVRLLGMVPEEVLPQWYQAADLFIMPSKALEGFGLATLEALACGTPAVGTPVGGTKELLERLDSSLLCESIQPEAMSAMILRTLLRLREAQAREEFSARCRVFAAQFGHEAMVARLESVYQQLVRVKVLHVHTMPVISGSGLNTFLTMRGQQDAGYTAELACAPASTSREYRDEGLAELVDQAGMRFHPIRHLRRSMSPWHDVGALIELWRLCRRRRYALVHTHNSKAGVLGRLAARLAGVPIVIHTHHSCVFRYRHLRPWQRGLFLWVERLLAPLTTSFIAISETLRNDLVAARVTPPDRTVVIYSGVEIERFRHPVVVEGDREALGVSRQDLVIGSIARLDVGKGHQELFESTAQLVREFPRLKVVCVGEGPLRSRLEEEIRRLHLEGRVILLGQRDNIPRLIQVFDIVVLASHYEGMGRVLLEAQAAGKPVVATKAGGMIDVVRDGESGYLVPVGDSAALAAAIGRLLADESLRNAMGERAARWVDARFSSRRMCEQIHALYDQLLKSSTR